EPPTGDFSPSPLEGEGRVEGVAKRRLSGSGEGAAAVVAKRLVELFGRVHDEGAVLRDGLANGPARKDNEAGAIIVGANFDPTAGREQARRLPRKRLRGFARADLDIAFIGVNEG